MKYMFLKQINILFFLAAAVSLVSCEKWTDVKPSVEMRGELVFSEEKTVQEALNGVYGRMTQTESYGRNMTWGFVDVMGGYYDQQRLQTYEVEVLNGRFDHISSERVIQQIWENNYYSLANANNLIAGIDKADPNIFTGNNKNLIKGEALGLRAMLHFDILRLFGPTAQSANWNQPILPYVKVYGSNVTSRIKGDDFVAQLLADLLEAEMLLADDRILNNISLEELRSRKVRLNYYAVKALQARIYMWVGNKEKALDAAKIVMDENETKFPWLKVENIESQGTFFDYILSSENVFSLYINQLRSHIEGSLVNIQVRETVPQDFVPHYSLTSQMRQQMYETGGTGISDYRNIYMLGSQIWKDKTLLLYKKLNQGIIGSGSEQRPYAYAENRLPMIKLSEMYYIAAECLVDTDPDQAIAYLNTVRDKRGVKPDLISSLTASQIQTEIRKEYRKEFPCEGQFFYYLKRTGEKNYTLPLPQREMEYGF